MAEIGAELTFSTTQIQIWGRRSDLLLKSWRPALNAFKRDWYDIERRWFVSEGAGVWQTLKAETIKEKQRKKYKHPERILYATGELQKSASSQSGKWSARTVTDTTEIFEIRWAPAVYHQLGMGHNPTRKIFVITPAVRKALQSRVKARINEVVTKPLPISNVPTPSSGNSLGDYLSHLD